MKAILFAALYGISNGYSPAQGQMCCTANVAMSHSYSVCEDVMNKYKNAADQKEACLNSGFTGKTGGEYTCKYAPCNDVGYCVDSRDNEYFDEMVAVKEEEANARRLMIEADYGNSGGNGRDNGYDSGNDGGYGNDNGNGYGNGNDYGNDNGNGYGSGNGNGYGNGNDGGNGYGSGNSNDGGYGNGNGNGYGNGGGYTTTKKPTEKPVGGGWGAPKPTNPYVEYMHICRV